MAEDIESKIEKLLRVAAGTANENESATALQLAQKLADAHNLDIGTIGNTGARADQKISKGLYQYQRNLYNALADLNHCKCWVSKGLKKGSSYEIRLLGSKMNVTIVRNMAEYLEGAVNSMVRDRYEPNEYFTKDAHAYRQGMVDTLINRVRKRREQEEAEREAAKREQEARQRHPGAATENAVILISDVSKAEERANYDYVYGEGSYDRMQQSVANYRAKMAETEAKYEAWKVEHPEEYAAEKAKVEKDAADREKEYARAEARREKARQKRIDEYGYDPQDYRSRKPSVYDNSAYWDGRDWGNEVNLDDQIDQQKRKGIK